MSEMVYRPNPASGVVHGQNLSRVEFENNDRRGYYIQIDAETWLNQDVDRVRVCSTFRELGRDPGGVDLKDSARDQRTRLNTNDGTVEVYQHGASEYIIASYPIRGMSGGQPRGISPSAKQFNDWYTSDGESRTGLPPNSMAPLNALLLDFRYGSAHIFHDVAKLKYLWAGIVSTQALRRCMPLLQVFTADLASVSKRCGPLLAQATECRILVEKFDGADAVLRARITELDAQVNESIRKINSGGGFRPLFGERLAERVTVEQTYTDQLRSLREAQGILRGVTSLNSALTDYQNYLSRAESAVTKALHDADRAEFSESDHVGNWYAGKAGKDMQALIDMTNSFPSAL